MEERGIRTTIITGDSHCGGYGLIKSYPGAQKGSGGGDAGGGGPGLPWDSLARDPKFIGQVSCSGCGSAGAGGQWQVWLRRGRGSVARVAYLVRGVGGRCGSGGAGGRWQVWLTW